jgi:hypothetical protein
LELLKKAHSSVTARAAAARSGLSVISRIHLALQERTSFVAWAKQAFALSCILYFDTWFLTFALEKIVVFFR